MERTWHVVKAWAHTSWEEFPRHKMRRYFILNKKDGLIFGANCLEKWWVVSVDVFGSSEQGRHLLAKKKVDGCCVQFHGLASSDLKALVLRKGSMLRDPPNRWIYYFNFIQEPLFLFPIWILLLVRTRSLVSKGIGLTFFLFTISQMNSKKHCKIFNPSQIPCWRAGGERSSVQRALAC